MEVYVVFYTQDGIVKHVKVFEDERKAHIELDYMKSITAGREDEDCDMVTCEVE